MMIINPLLSTPGMSDPHVYVTGDRVFLYTGHDVGHGKQDWIMPEWRIFTSTTLNNWQQVGTISPEDTYMGKGNTSCWAGDIAQRNGKMYWYFSNRKENTGVMVADAPEGPFRDALGKPLVDSFDPTIFTDDDGTPYIIYGEGDYKIARLKENMIELAETPRQIDLNRKHTFPFMDKNSLHKHNGIYYLSCSGYYAVSDTVYGSYVYRGLVGSGWGLESPFAHGDFFTWQGKDYHVWCNYQNRDVDLVRNCFIAPVSYGEDGAMVDDLSQLQKTALDHKWM
jgi:hypothetical protein